MGMQLTAEAGNVMRFLSWDGYHHHLGINLLEGRGAAPVGPAAAGLVGFEVGRIDAPTRDPDGIEVTLPKA
jgi:catechol 2,3-dioxygenase